MYNCSTFITSTNPVFMKSIVFLSALLMAVSCSTSKSTGNQSSMQNMEEEKKMLAEGYLKGTIKVYSSEGNCPYVIKVAAANPYYFDPVNLDEAFKMDGEKIWFKYNGLGMMNRCEKAVPVSLSAIKKRAE